MAVGGVGVMLVLCDARVFHFVNLHTTAMALFVANRS